MSAIFTLLLALTSYFFCTSRISICNDFNFQLASVPRSGIMLATFKCICSNTRENPKGVPFVLAMLAGVDNSGVHNLGMELHRISEILSPRGCEFLFAIYLWYIWRHILNAWKAFLNQYPMKANMMCYMGCVLFHIISEPVAWFNWNLTE